MASHTRHVRRPCRSWWAGLAASVVVAASLASVNAASAAPAASSADCSGAASLAPLVPFNTIAYSGTPAVAGVQVGAMFCPDPDGQAVQVVVLDSATLRLVSNRGYASSQFAQLGSDLNSLPTSDLVIVTHPGDQEALPSGTLAQLDTSLGVIGGTVAAQWSFGQNSTATGCSSLNTNYCGYGGATWQRGTFSGSSFTVIGIPKMAAGQAWRETAAQNHTADGRITGYLEVGTLLTGGQNGGPSRYTVVNGPDPYVPVDTCIDPADPDNLNDPWCAVKVGDHTYPAESGVNGLHVVELDRTTLDLIANRTVTSAADLNSIFGTSWLPVPPVAHFINPTNFLNDQRVVILQSVGDGKLSGTLGGATLQAIDQLGGTVDYLAAAATQGCRYALVGAATDLPWHATTSAESSTAMVKPEQPCSNPDNETPDQPTGHVYGVVQRDRDGLYAPGAADAVGPTNVDLYPILYQPPTAWPYAGDTTNLKYVADNIGLSGYPDVRSAYTNTNFKLSWGNFRSDLNALTCPPSPGQTGACDPGSFGELKDELVAEFAWVPLVYALADNLRAPYEQAGGSGPFDVKNVTQQIVNSIPVPPDDTATMQWLKIFSTSMTIASTVAGLASPAGKAVFGVLGGAATIATYLMQQPGGGPANSVTTAADNLGNQLENQQLAYLEWVNNAQDILLSYYGQLSKVGTAIQHDTSWNWTGSTTNNLITALQAGTRASAYSALLPVAWGGYNLKAITATSTGPLPNPADANDVTKYGCSEYDELVTDGHVYEGVNTTHPFKNALPQNQFHSVSGFNGSTGAVLNQVWTFATDVHGFADDDYPAATVPSTDLTSDIYGADSTSPQSGAYQYEASWWRSTYNPPSHATCAQLTAPNSGLTRPYSVASPPPSITPPLP